MSDIGRNNGTVPKWVQQTGGAIIGTIVALGGAFLAWSDLRNNDGIHTILISENKDDVTDNSKRISTHENVINDMITTQELIKRALEKELQDRRQYRENTTKSLKTIIDNQRRPQR